MSDATAPRVERLWPRAIAVAGLLVGWRAFRLNVLPAVVLWVVATGIVLGYYLVPPVTAMLDGLGDVKQHHGFLYSAISTAIFGAAVPWLVTRARLGPRGQGRWSFALLLVVFWAVKGVEVDALYRLQDWVWGSGRDVVTIASKVLADMFFYMPLWGVLSTVAAYQFERVDFRWSAWWRSMDGRWLAHAVLPVIVVNWVVWVPAVTGIYLLPLPLQIPMQNLVLCLWALMLIVMTDEAARECREPAT